jgi:hypothetical protein
VYKSAENSNNVPQVIIGNCALELWKGILHEHLIPLNRDISRRDLAKQIMVFFTQFYVTWMKLGETSIKGIDDHKQE